VVDPIVTLYMILCGEDKPSMATVPWTLENFIEIILQHPSRNMMTRGSFRAEIADYSRGGEGRGEWIAAETRDDIYLEEW
jgi:hypothetical protein